jgi:hypothetical protein
VGGGERERERRRRHLKTQGWKHNCCQLLGKTAMFGIAVESINCYIPFRKQFDNIYKVL